MLRFSFLIFRKHWNFMFVWLSVVLLYFEKLISEKLRKALWHYVWFKEILIDDIIFFMISSKAIKKCFKWIKNTQRCTFRYKILKNSLILMRNAAILAIKTNYEFTPWIYLCDPLFLWNTLATYITLALIWICRHAPFIKSMRQFLPKKLVINSILAWSVRTWSS